MTISTSGPISLKDLQTEFGGPSPIVMSNYYAGGAYVPSSASGVNGAIPSSGALTLGDFRGSSKITGPQWLFDVTSESADLSVTNFAGDGLPTGYDASYHGAAIWPYTMPAGSTGWVGTYFVSAVSEIYIATACDDAAQIYVNGVKVIDISDWNVWGQATVPVMAGAGVTVCARVVDGGDRRAFVCRIADTSGNVIKLSGDDWVSGQ